MQADATARKQGNQGWFQFSIKGLLGMAVFVAIGCGALLRPSPWWTMFLASATVLWLLGAILAIVYGRGPSRAFWVGFAVFGWGYVALLYGPWAAPFQSPGRPISDSLFTTQLLTSAYAHHPSLPTISLMPTRYSGPGPNTPPPATSMQVAPQAFSAFVPPPVIPPYEEFMPSGHWLWTVTLAWFGGWLARYFHARSLRLAAAPIDPGVPSQ